MEMEFKPGSTASDAGDIKCEFESDPEYDEELRRINLERRRRNNIGQTERGFEKVPLQTAMVSTDFVKTEPEDDYEAAPTPPVAVAPPVETMTVSYEVDIKPYLDGVKPEPQDENGGIGVPPTKKQEKSQSAPAAITNQNNITKEVENEANIALDSNKDVNFIVTEKCTCSFCGKRFEDKSLLIVHLKCHNSELNIYFDCEVCDYQSVTRDSLEKHMRVHDVQKPFQCNICEKRFVAKGHLKRHLRIHSGEKPYVCNVCDKSFTVCSHLKTHLRMHSGEKPYVCNVCYKRFTESGHLKAHLRIHSGEKPYVCNVCDKRFTESGNLKTHLRTHSGEKPYVCNICDKRFIVSSHLKKHFRIHSGEKS